MFCSECGSKIEDGARFCGSCGAKVVVFDEPVAEAVQEAVAQAAPVVQETVQEVVAPVQEAVAQAAPAVQQAVEQVAAPVQEAVAQAAPAAQQAVEQVAAPVQEAVEQVATPVAPQAAVPVPPAAGYTPIPEEKPEKKKKGKGGLVAVLLLLLIIGGGCAAVYFTPLKDTVLPMIGLGQKAGFEGTWTVKKVAISDTYEAFGEENREKVEFSSLTIFENYVYKNAKVVITEDEIDLTKLGAKKYAISEFKKVENGDETCYELRDAEGNGVNIYYNSTKDTLEVVNVKNGNISCPQLKLYK